MSVERENAVKNNTINLNNYFKYGQTGDYFTPYAISKVEILDTDGVTVIETITGASIVADAVGKYHVIAAAITTPKVIYDKWYFTPSAGAVEITKTNTCIVWEVDPDTMLSLSSTVEICNLALAHLGQNAITSLDDPDSKSARELQKIFNITKDTVLRAKDWNFARVKTALSELSGQEGYGWDYVYAYPARCLAIRKVFDDIENYKVKGVEYEVGYIPAINAKVIFCNNESAYATYTYQITDTTLFDKSFIMAFSFLLASQVAKPLTGNDDIAKLMLQLYGSLVSDASRIASKEEKITPTEESAIESSRG